MNIREDTARTIVVGPILDADGVAKTDEVVASVLASKNGGAPGALDGSATLAHQHTGNYLLALTANDTDTAGVLELSLSSTTNVMPVKSVNVMPTAKWDALYGVTYLQVNTCAISSSGPAADNLKAAFNGTGYAFTNCVMPTVSTLTGHTAQTGDNYARIGAPVGASISADLADVPTVTEFNARTLPSADYVVVTDTIAGVTLVTTTTTLTNLPAATADWLDAAAVKADAVTKLTASAVQANARMVNRISGTVYFVATSGNDGNDGLTPATAKLTPKTVIEAMSANDGCIIGPGTFASASYILAVTKTKVMGSGLGLTRWTTNVSSSLSWKLATDCVIEDMTIACTGASNNGVGCDQYMTAATGAVLRRVQIESTFDCIYLQHTSPCSVKIFDCVLESDYDCLAIWDIASGSVAHKADLYDCSLDAYRTAATRADGVYVSCTTSVVRLYDCNIRARAMGASQTGAGVAVAKGTAIVHGGSIYGYGDGASYDLEQSGAGILQIYGTQYDRAKTSGTITEAATDLDVQLHTTQPNYVPSTHSAADVRAAIGMAAANLDTQLDAIVEDTGTTLPALIEQGVTTGTVVDEAATTTSFISSMTEATNNHYKGNVLAFTAGTLATQARRISAYNGTTKTITLESALTDAPANGAAFMILGRIEAS